MDGSTRKSFVDTLFGNRRKIKTHYIFTILCFPDMVQGRGGGISMVVALVWRSAQVVVHHGETKLMVSCSQSMRGL